LSIVKTLRIILNDGRTLNWNLDFSDQGTLQMDRLLFSEPQPWIRLGYHKCPACRLEAETNPTCPVAEILAQYARDLAENKSFERVKVHIVEEDGRHILLTDVPLQNVVGELVRLAVYQSGCPVGRQIKPAMTRLHLFPTNEEILKALAQFFALRARQPRRADAAFPETTRASGDLDPEQLEFMNSLHDVFGCLSKRLEEAGKGDVYLNALVIMHSLSLLFSLSAPTLIQTAIAESKFW